MEVIILDEFAFDSADTTEYGQCGAEGLRNSGKVVLTKKAPY
jgi:hypothetical protein